MMMLDRTKPFPTNGRWWIDQWWVDHADQYHLPCPPDEISVAVETLVAHFDEAWADALIASGQLPAHPIGWKLMCLRGTYSAVLMIQLARQIRLFSAEPTFTGKLEKLLSPNHQDVSSVMFELGVAQLFADEGAKIIFPRETNKAKTHDITATFGLETVNIECKDLQGEVWEEWVDSLMTKVILSLPTAHGDTALAFEVLLHPRIADIIREPWHKNDTANAMSDAFAIRIREEVLHRLETEGVPFQCAISDLCTIMAREKLEGFGGVGGTPLSPPAIFRRIIANALEPAAKQLPKDRAGLVAVFSKHVPTYEFAKLVFDTLMESMTSEYEHVAGMVIFTQQYIGAERRKPYFLVNARCKYSQGALRIVDTIERQAGAILPTSSQ